MEAAINSLDFYDFISRIVTTFLGAVLAFIFALAMYHYQRKSNDIAYLNYTLAVLAGATGPLYVLKKDILQERIPFINKLQNQLMKGTLSPSQPVQLGALTLHILHGEFKANIDLEKLSFIAITHPNIIMLLASALESISKCDDMVNQANSSAEAIRESERLGIEKIVMLVSINQNLIEQVDQTLYQLEKSFEVLFKFSKLKFKKKIKITGKKFVGEEYEALKPAPMQSWEKYTWFPKKKTLLERLKSKFKKSN
jgi:hypothetical protein